MGKDNTIHRFKGDWVKDMTWDGARTRVYKGASQATETWLIGKAEKAQNFAMRFYTLGPEGHSVKEDHSYDHGVIFMSGQGEVLLGDDWHPVTQGDVVYIAVDEVHQIRNTGEDTLGWLCVIPARRRKKGKEVWAEEGLEDEFEET